MEKEHRLFDEDRDFKQEILDILNTPLDQEDLMELLEEYHPYDISRAVLDEDVQKMNQIFNVIDITLSANIFEHFDHEDAIEIIRILPLQLAVKIIDHMDSDDAVDLLQYLHDEEEDLDIVSLLSPKKRAELKRLWDYKESEIGSSMSNSFIEFSKKMTVKDAMKRMIQKASETEFISIIYVVEKQKLVGYLKLKQLIVARAEELIEDIMETKIYYAHPHDDKEEVAMMMQDYGDSAMPIVDEDLHIVGIVTHDDLMDIISESKTEDYTKFAALSDSDIDLETESLLDGVKKRLPWLAILLGLSMVTSVILSFFEGHLTSSDGAKILAASLAIYLPLILDMSGNTGTQSLAVMIRFLSTSKKEITRKVITRYLLREVGTGIAQGLLLGVMIFAMMIVVNYIGSGNLFEYVSTMTALVTSASICIALIVSTLLGAVIPLFMDKLHIDPAVASGPFITTVSDIITLSLYYSISLAILLPLYL